MPGLAGISTATGATIAAGATHNLAVTTSGNVYAWGDSNFGKLGNTTIDARTVYTPTLVKATDGVADLGGITVVGAGGDHSLAVGPGGSVYGWGYNYYGQLGSGSTAQSAVGTPVQVASLTGVASIVGGLNHSVALKADGTVWAWGHGQYGQIGNDTANSTWGARANFVPLQVQYPDNTGYLGGVTAVAANNHNLVIVSPRAALSAASLTYGKHVAGSTSPSQTVTLTNTGSIAMSVSASTTGDFAQTNDCTSSLAPNATCTFTVTFTPTAVGTPTGSLDIADDAPGNPHVVALSGEGTAPLVLSSISPPSGSTAGGTLVTITGSGIQSTATVSVGGVTCTSPSVATNGTSVGCTTGVHAAGLVNVVVTNPDDGQVKTMTAAFTYVLPPTVSSVNPPSGPTAGGTSVTVTGTDFQGAATVSIGGSACAVTGRTASTAIVCTTGLHGMPGAFDVVVTNDDNQPSTQAIKYTYVAPPTVSSVNPPSGPTAGGTSVTVTGTDFQGAATVSIGGSACGVTSRSGSTSITCTTGGHVAAGAFDVVVKNDDNQTSTQAVKYTYVLPPTVSTIAPASGPTAGGQAVTITGSDFQSGATVSIGGSTCAVTGTTTSAAVACTTGPHGWGPFNVEVRNPDGQTSHQVTYTYVAPAPTIGGVTPSGGPVAGGTVVTISGSNFMSGATVSIGGTSATSVTFDNSGQLRATTPGHAAGTVDVVVTNPDGQAVTTTGAYTYVAPAPPAPAPLTGPGGNYSGWQHLEGLGQGLAPALVSFQQQLYVIVVGRDHQVYERHSAEGVTFSGWRPLGGATRERVVATVYGGQLYLFARGVDDHLYASQSADGVSFSGWRSVGGVVNSAAAVAEHNGQLFVFVRGADNGLYVSLTADGASFTAWRPLGGQLAGTPLATSFGGRLVVYVDGLDQTLYGISAADGVSFTGWSQLGPRPPRLAVDSTVIAVNQGQLVLYGRGTDRRLYGLGSMDGVHFGPGRDLGGVLVSGPAVVSVGNTLVVYVRGADNQLWEARSGDGGATYSAWRNLAGVVVATPVATDFLNEVYLVTEGADGQLYGQRTRP